MQAGAVAVAEEDEGARPLVEHEGEISAAMRGGVSVSTLSLPTISRATPAAKAVSLSWFTTTG